MSLRLGLLLALLVTASGCTRSPPPAESTTTPAMDEPAASSEPQSPSPAGKVTNSAPWSIQFHPRGMSTLHNGTDRGFWILHDAYLQPSRLEVSRPDGTLAAEFDTRSIKKFDATIRKENFRYIEPNSELPLFELRVTQQEGSFELSWGPFRIGPLPAGSYSASVIWEAREAQSFDDASGKIETLEGAFVGKVESPAIPLRLPLP